MEGTAFWVVALISSILVGLSKGGLPVVAMLSVPLLALVMPPVAAAGLLLPVYIVSDMFGAVTGPGSGLVYAADFEPGEPEGGGGYAAPELMDGASVVVVWSVSLADGSSPNARRAIPTAAISPVRPAIAMAPAGAAGPRL